MKIRLVILVVMLLVAGGVFVAVISQPKENHDYSTAIDYGRDDDKGKFQTKKCLVAEAEDPPGETPDVEPEFTVVVRTEPDDGKKRLYFDITETHGFFAEPLNLEVFYVREGGDESDRVSIASYSFNDVIKTNETLSTCMDLVDPEIERAGGDMGVSERWAAEVVAWGRVRLENPPADWEGYLCIPPDRGASCR